jgi:hypothetical protein
MSENGGVSEILSGGLRKSPTKNFKHYLILIVKVSTII